MGADEGKRKRNRARQWSFFVKVCNPEPNLTEVRLFEPPLVTCPWGSGRPVS